MKFLLLIFDNIRRNPVRSLLTSLGTVVLVLVVTLVWSVLSFLDRATTEKSQDFKAVVSEKWRLPSQMPYAYATGLKEAAARKSGDVRPTDSMTWTFLGGATDPDLKKRTNDNSVFAFCLEPSKLLTMMDELDSLPPDQKAEWAKVVDKLEKDRTGIIIGRKRLQMIGKRVGDRFKLYSFNYKDINLEVEVVGEFPPGRYDLSAAMNIDYLLAALDAYPRTHNNQKHPMAARSLNLVWLRLPDRAAFTKAAEQILADASFSDPAVKVETEAAGISTFLEAYRDLLWGMRWLLGPSIVVTLALVISNAISISVRERQREFAVMKVLGYQPYHLLIFVLGEALLVGAGAGAISALATFVVINYYIGGIPFPIAFFGSFFIPAAALWWGPAIGFFAALAGSIFPAWQARSVRVSDVFARIG